MKEEKKEPKYIRIFGFEMERYEWISFFIGLAMAVIGFTLLVLGGSPSWFNPLVSALGITGSIGSWISVFIGATKKALHREQVLTREILNEHTRTLNEQTRILGEHTALLREIRDSLRNMINRAG
jgi:ABC-type sulfate transport system permease component